MPRNHLQRIFSTDLRANSVMKMRLMRRFVGAQRYLRSTFSTFKSSSSDMILLDHGRSIDRESLFKYTNGRFLMKEDEACRRRYLRFDLESLCSVASSACGSSPVSQVEKMEGGFSKALLMKCENGAQVVAKLPFAIAGPPKYTTAAEVAALRYVSQHTSLPVPKVLAWSFDASNPVGAEYIIMEKAPGIQLFRKWDSMNERQKFFLVESLAKLEGELTRVRFPVYGSLYLRETMSAGESYTSLDSSIDPKGQFCIGPTCDRAWYDRNKKILATSTLGRGPWSSLSDFGLALVNREMTRIKEAPKVTSYPLWSETCEEQMQTLDIVKLVMSKLDSGTLLDMTSRPALWHTDLHMGNIYVDEEDPTKIVSIIDWQGLTVSPLFLQARFPEFLSIDESYEFGLDMPQRPDGYDALSGDDKEIADAKFEKVFLSKVYELATGAQNNPAYKALYIPWYLRNIFVRCADVTSQGITPLRECLFEVAKVWSEARFSDECPFSFNERDMDYHKQQFAKYSQYHEIQELAMELLSTDSEGWYQPRVDFAEKQQQNEELFKLLIERSATYDLSPEDIRKIWPFQ